MVCVVWVVACGLWCVRGRVGGVVFSVCAACVGSRLGEGVRMTRGVHEFLSGLRVGGYGFGTP